MQVGQHWYAVWTRQVCSLDNIGMQIGQGGYAVWTRLVCSLDKRQVCSLDKVDIHAVWPRLARN